jgi:predicted DCC family thiol-disulfide oxidoreductase YuxK
MLPKPGLRSILGVYGNLNFMAETKNNWQLKLLFDGQCPFCRREVAWLKRRDHGGKLAVEDISMPGFDATRYGLTQREVEGVMHGIFPDGRIVTRVATFRAAYRLVGLGWLIAPTAWPGLCWVADKGYDWFARHRVRIGSWFGGPKCENGSCRIAPEKK